MNRFGQWSGESLLCGRWCVNVVFSGICKCFVLFRDKVQLNILCYNYRRRHIWCICVIIMHSRQALRMSLNPRKKVGKVILGYGNMIFGV